jgi:hypothetical protein
MHAVFLDKRIISWTRVKFNTGEIYSKKKKLQILLYVVIIVKFTALI